MNAPTIRETHNNGKVQRELPLPEEMAKGKVNAKEIIIPFHHHGTQGKLK